MDSHKARPVLEAETTADADPGQDADPGASADADAADQQDQLTCGANSDCPCPDGICLDTGVCYCPPCETDDDCPPGEVCRAGACVVLPPECLLPLRVTPDRGPTTGGTVLQVTGSEFYIGAMAWLVRIGEGPWLWAMDGAPCSLSTLTPPMPAGTYPVSVLYGWPYPAPAPPPDQEQPAGYFTYEQYDGEIGTNTCTSSLQCDTTWEYCDLGLGRCVPDLCRSLACPGDDEFCDSLLGCQEQSQGCASSSDCKMIYNSCYCQAVPASDSRTEITSCALGGCTDCMFNECEMSPRIVAACRNGQCVERFADPEGVACAVLEPELLPETLQSGDWISVPRAARHGERVALVWTEPEGEPYFRHGTVRLAVVDADGRLGPGGIAVVDGPQPRASQVAVASGGGGLGVVWMREQSSRELRFRRYDTEGASVLAEAVVSDVVEVGGHPWLFDRDDGFDLFWPVHDYMVDDGLYHAMLDPSGVPAGEPERMEWLLPQSGDLSAARLGTSGDHALAWQSALHDLPGVYLTDFPRSGAPLIQLSKTGTTVGLASTGSGVSALWRETHASGTQNRAYLYLQSFDAQGQSFSEPVYVDYHWPVLLEPRVAYLGGVILVQWFERDSWDDTAPVRLMSTQLDEIGSRIATTAEVLTAPAQTSGLFQVRLANTILSGYVERGGTVDTMRFVRWHCME